LQVQGRQIEVVHQAENSTEDLLADLTSIILDIVSFLYGRKKSKEHAEQINACVEQIMKAEDE
jgi:predicted site-specific integrase-resolvase